MLTSRTTVFKIYLHRIYPYNVKTLLRNRARRIKKIIWRREVCFDEQLKSQH